MKRLIKTVLGMIGLILFITNTSVAKKQFVPIVNDDILTMASYYTTTNNLNIPSVSADNGFADLVIQCEEDITYFIMASHIFFDDVVLTTSSGTIVIEEEGLLNGDTAYKKGYIEGNESLSITGEVYYNNQLMGETTKSCSRTTSDTTNTLQVPTFTGLSQGALVTQCEDNVVYFIMAYNCLRSDTRPSVLTSSGTIIEEERGKINNTFYVKGYVEKTGSVTITGEVFSGGQVLYTWPSWIQSCP